MVDDSITDGRRIGQLLASEITGLERGPLAEMAVVDADSDAEPTSDGTFAYGVAFEATRLADAYIQPDRAYLEFRVGVDTARDAAAAADLRVRPKATTPPRTLVFVETGATVKRAVDVLEAVGESIDTESSASEH
jgi:hypothetical protein